MTLRWYAVGTKRGCEPQAAVNLTAQGCTVLCPIQKRQVMRNRKLEWVERPLIDRIVFARFDRSDLSNFSWGKIKYTRGCRGVLKNGQGIPSPIRDAVIEHMRSRNEAQPEPDLGFAPGDEIEIRVGPYAEMSAVLVGYSAGMATVRLSLFGRDFLKDFALRDLARRATILEGRRTA